MNEEITGGLNTAIAHGVSLEEAAQSFINAGYNAAEVREAQTVLGRGFAPLPKTATAEPKPAASASPVSFASSTPMVSQPTETKQETRQASKKTIILLVVLALLVLIAGIASVLMLYLK